MRAITAYAASALFAGLLLTGCGVGGSGGGSGDAAGEPAGADSSASFDEAFQEYAQCMRDNGVDMEDPVPGEARPALEMNETTEAALEECEDLVPVDENAPSEEERHEQAVETAECLREHGIDVPDPEPGQGLTLSLGDGSDEDREAAAACAGIDPQQLEAEGDAGQ
ncbi:hypothetical protein ACFOVU_08780 [Nocardiopsis sediminis]|uniref:Secreted protein n=1 Tax=Nocardiopsis sediminis TaxID=1778267 RepID=A0ABV8FIQ8_9ACTN